MTNIPLVNTQQLTQYAVAENSATQQKLRRIIFRAGFLQGADVEAFDGVDHLGSLPGKHQLWTGLLVSMIYVGLWPHTKYGLAVEPVVSAKTSSFKTTETSESLYLNHSSG